MSTARGLVTNTITFSAVDGPGNRFVVFLQGCNFDCITCHNPHTITACTHCGVCVTPCPEDALGLTPGPNVSVTVDWGLCTRCDVCTQVCPEGSTPLAVERSVDDVIAEILPAAPFLSGITVSGGEATLQTPFLVELFTAIRSQPDLAHLSILVDTNGAATRATWDRLAPVMDGAMVDLKALDDDTHVRLTARSNAAVLDSIRYLANIGELHEVRLLLVPGYNDDPEVMDRTAEWLASVDPGMRVKVFGYRPHGVRVDAAHIGAADQETIHAQAAALRRAGIERIEVVEPLVPASATV